MKIFYISASDIPSSSANSIHVVKMCSAFAELGNDVVLTACTGGMDVAEVYSALPGYYGVGANFSVLPVNVPKVPGFSYIHGCLAAGKIRSVKPDLVFTRSLHAAVLAAFLGWPVIFEAHSPMRETGKINDFLFRLLIKSKNFLGLVVITHALKDHYSLYKNLNPKRVFVAPDGADIISGCNVDSEHPLNDVGVAAAILNGSQDAGRLQVGYVGHLYPGKGMEIIAPLARLADGVDFTVVGGVGTDLQHWKEVCTGLSNINFVGQVPHGVVPDYLKKFDVVLLPNQVSVKSRGDVNIGQWTSPLKAFEYMAAGKAILASDIPVLREVLENEVNALLCKPDDVQSWLCQLQRLTDDPALIKKIGDRARSIFEQSYTWKSRATNILKYFSFHKE